MNKFANLIRKNKIKFILFAMVILLASITLGAAILSSTLNINGTASIQESSWVIYFTDVRKSTDSVASENDARIVNFEKTRIEFTADLKSAGDFYEFTVYTVNDGTIDAMVDSIEKATLTEEQQKYLDFSVTYDNGDEIRRCDALNAGTRRRIKAIVKYKDGLDMNDYPTEDVHLNLYFNINYVQKDDACPPRELDDKYLLTIVPNGGVYQGRTDEIRIYMDEGDSYNIDTPIRNLYNFTGWEANPEQGTYSISNNVFTMGKENVTLTAGWEEGDYVARIMDTYYPSIQLAFDAAKHSDFADNTVYLLKDTTENPTNNTTDDFVFNLSGYTVTGTMTNSSVGDITIINGKFLNENADSITVRNYGNLVMGIDDNDVQVESSISIIGDSVGLQNEEGSTFYIYDGYLQATHALVGGYTGKADGYYLIVDYRKNIQKDRVYLVRDNNRAVAKTTTNGELYYYNLQSAIEEVEGNKKDNSSLTDNDYIISIIRNFEAAYEINVDNDSRIFIDTDGHNINFGEDITNLGYLDLYNSKESISTLKFAKTITNSNALLIDDLVLEASSNSNIINNTGALTITDSTLHSKYGYDINNSGNGTISLDDETLLLSDDGYAIFNSGSNLNITAGTIYGFNNNGTATISGGTFITFVDKTQDQHYTRYTNGINNNGTITMTGGTVHNDVNTNPIVNRGTFNYYDGDLNSSTTLVDNNSGNFNVLGGDIVSEAVVISGGTVTINGGNVTSDTSTAINGSASVTVTSGEVKSNVGKAIDINGSVNVNGGSVTGKTNAVTSNSFTISGGTVTSEGTGVSTGSATISGGTITSSGNALSTNTINMTGGTVTSTENNGVTINSSGTITGGTVQGDVYGIDSKGQITLGSDDGTVSTTNPVIIGNSYGIFLEGTDNNFYDGIIKGQVDSYSGNFTGLPSGGFVADGEETISGNTYETSYISSYENWLRVGSTEYNTIDAASAAITGETGTIEVIRDANLNFGQTFLAENNKTITFDLQGHSITTTQNITNSSKSNLIITDSTSNKDGSMTFNAKTGFINNGTTTIEEGVYTTVNPYIITNNSVLNINGGILTTTGDAINNNNHILNINGGTITGSTAVSNIYGSVTMTGGTINASNYGVYNGLFTMSGGTLNSNNIGVYYATTHIIDGIIHTGSKAIYAYGTSVNIEGGTITSDSDIAVDGRRTVNISGGVITGTTGVYHTTYSDGYYIYQDNMTITGGTITGTTNEGIVTYCGTLNYSNATTRGATYGLLVSHNTNNYFAGAVITSGSIKGETYGIYNFDTVVLGTNDSEISKISPLIMGGSYGVYNVDDRNATFRFFDGILKGLTDGHYGLVKEIPDASMVVDDYEFIDRVEWQTEYIGEQADWIRVGDRTFNSINKAAEYIDSEGTMYLLNDVSISFDQELPADKTITFDLNGHTLIMTNPLKVNGTNTLKDSVGNGGINNIKDRVLSIGTTGSLTIESGTYNSSNSSTISNGGTVIMNGGTITSTKSGVYAIESSSSLTVNAGEINAPKGISNSGTASITGGTITATDGVAISNSGNLNILDNAYIVSNTSRALELSNGVTNISSGTIKSLTDSAILVEGYNVPVLNITGGEIDGDYNGISTGSSSVNISGGHIIGRRNVGVSAYSTTNITGGSIEGATYGVYTIGNTILGNNDGIVSIDEPSIKGELYGLYIERGTVNFYDGILKGITDAYTGSITNIPDRTEIFNDVERIDNYDYKTAYLLTESVIAVNTTTNVDYTNLQDALDEANNNETVKLLANVPLYYEVINNNDNNITLDMNGFRITTNKRIINNKNLTIKNDGENDSFIRTSSGINLITNTGTLNTNNIEIINNSSSSYVINNAGSLSLTNSKVTGINNISSSNSLTMNNSAISSTNIAINNTGSLDVTGGTITGNYYSVYANNNKTNSLVGCTITGTYYNSGGNNTTFTNSIINSSIQNYSSTVTSIGSTYNYSIYNAGTFALQNASTLNGVISSNTGTFNIIDSIVNSSSDRIIYNSGTMNINNSSVNANRDSGDSRLINNNGTLSITNNSNIVAGSTSKGSSYMGIYSYGNGNATIEDSNISLDSNNNVYGVYLDSANSHITIKTGTIETTGSTSYGAYVANGTFTMGELDKTEASGTEDADVSTTNPRIYSVGRAQGIGVKHNNANFEFYDGIVWGSKYAKPDITTLVELNYEVTTYVDTATGYEYSLLEYMRNDYQNSVALLNGVYYETVQGAINKVESADDEILILKSVTEDGLNIPVNSTVKINLNGKSITTQVINNGTLNVYNGSLQNFDETAVINNGTFIIGQNDGTISSTNIRIVSETVTIQNNGTVKMYDGYLQGVPSINGVIDEIPNLSRIYTELTDQMERKYLQSLDEQSIIDGLTKLIITIDPNYGVYNGSSDIQYVYENYHVPYTLLTPTKNGCTFDGWEISDSSVLSGSGTEQDPYVITLELSDITIKAKWEVNDDVVAQIGNNYYTSVMSAINDAKDGDKITLLKDVVEDVTNNKNVTIDLNNNTITGAFVNNGILRLINGTIENPNGPGLVNNKTLTMGERDGQVIVDSIKIMGTTLGLEQNGSFNFYDGYIEGDVAILGRTDSVPNGYFLYNERNTLKNCQRVYLIGNPANAVAVIEDGGTQYFFSLQDAINTATISGSEIFIVRDFEATYPITVDQDADILINVSGYNITTGNDITNNGTLKIYDTSEEKGSITSSKTITNNGTMTIEDISITENNTNNNAINSPANSSLVVKNATITAVNGYAINSLGNLSLQENYELASNSYSLYAGGTNDEITSGKIGGINLNSDLTIGGTVNITSKVAGIVINSNVNLTMNGGLVKTINQNSGIVNDSGSSNITMNGGTVEAYYGFSCNSSNTHYILNDGTITSSDIGARMQSDNCHFTMNGGSITASSVGIYTYGQSNEITMTDGTVTSTSNDGLRDERNKNTTYSNNTYPYFSKINITGGKITGARYGMYVRYSITNISNAEIMTTIGNDVTINNYDWGILNLNEGAFINAPNGYGIYNNSSMTMNEGSRIYAGNNSAYGIGGGHNRLTMNGGTIETPGTNANGINDESNLFVMDMNGGTIISGNIGIRLVNSGNYDRTLTINSGTIIGETYGIYQTQNYTTTIGNVNEELSTEIPYITGGLYGYYKSAGTSYFYNGRLRGSTYGYNDMFNTIRTKMDIAEEIEGSVTDDKNTTYSVSTYSGTPTENTPKSGNGYARITYLGENDAVCTNNQTWTFEYRNSEYSFLVPCTGDYKLEVWGAQGGSYGQNGGFGSYSKGDINLSAGETLYINVGEQPSTNAGGYNGGGQAGTLYNARGGGGATHIATSSGLLSSLENDKGSIIIVAGGGGGSDYYSGGSTGGQAGGFIGGNGNTRNAGGLFLNPATGGTQESGGKGASGACTGESGSFGQGGTICSGHGGGGGGGYYGGGGGAYNSGHVASGAGGSGYTNSLRLTNTVMYGYNVKAHNTVDYYINYLVEREGFVEVDGHVFNSFDEASQYIVDYLNGVGTMNVIKDITIQEESNINGTTITLDLQGHSVTTTKTIYNNSDLTIEDSLSTGKIENNKSNAITNNGNITLDGVYIKATGYDAINGATGTGNIVITDSKLEGARGIYVTTGQTITITNSEITTTRDVLRTESNATVIVNSGTFRSTDVGIRLQADNCTLTINDVDLVSSNVSLYSYGQSNTINIIDGTITSTNNDGIRDDRSKNTSISGDVRPYFTTINITGGTITGYRYGIYDTYNYVNISNAEIKTTTNNYAIYNYTWSTLRLNDGAFVNAPNGSGIYNHSGIILNPGSRIYAGYNSGYGIAGGYNSITMNGGSIETPGTGAYGIYDSSDACNITMNDGTITSGHIGVGLVNGNNYDRTFTMNGGSITGNTYGVYQTQNYVTTIGNSEDELSTTIPYISGGLYGYYKRTGTSYFYNGRLRGSTFGYNDIFNNIRYKKDIVTEYEAGIADSTLTYATNKTSSLPISDTAKEDDGFVRITYLGATNEVCTNNQVYEFDYTGTEEIFAAPCAGDYKIEAWGAQGGSFSEAYMGGYGAYSTGTITLVSNEELFINVGEEGKFCDSGRCNGTYNGGGDAITGSQNSSTGGGATSIALSTGTLYELGQNNLQSDVIMVAAGGGGTGQSGIGGSGGGLKGSSGVSSNNDYTGSYGGTGATQSAGGTKENGSLCGSSGLNSTGQFGLGGSSADSSCGGSGGGGGYYGGGGSLRQHNGAGGGSSYIGHSRLTDAYMYGYLVATSSGVWVNNYLGDMDSYLRVGSEVFNSFEDAIGYIVDNLSGTGTIEVLKDVTTLETVTFPSSTNITVDLQGHGIIISNKITNNSSLVIKDTVGNGFIHNKKGDTIENNLNLTVDGAAIITSGDAAIWARTGTGNLVLQNNARLDGSRAIVIDSAQKVTVSDTYMNTLSDAIRTNANNVNLTINSGTVINARDLGIRLQSSSVNLTVNGGTITGYNYGIYSYGTTNTITINDGDITGTVNDGLREDYTSNGGTITITGGTITGGRYGLYNYGELVTIENAEIKTTSNNRDHYALYTSWGNTYLNDGTFINAPNASGIWAEDDLYIEAGSRIYAGNRSGYGIAERWAQSFEINGGSIETPGYNAMGIYSYDNLVNITMNSGSITSGHIGIYLNTSGNYTRTLTVNGGSISGETYGIYQAQNYVTTIGNDEDELSTEIPYITGGLYGIYNTAGTVNLYNGRLRGRTYGYYNPINEIREEKIIKEEVESSSTEDTLTYSVNTSSSTATVNTPKSGAGQARITYLGETNGTYTANQTFDYTYQGTEETFTPLVAGKYSIEVWGAQGGTINSSNVGGYGGYSYGEIELEANETLYINVGGQGSYSNSQIAGGYNGGGSATGGYCNGNRYAASGGGATHVATASGLLSSLENNKSSIIIVAGGGGGSSTYGAYGSGGSGGGFEGAKGMFTLSGHSYTQYATGGTQTSGGIKGNSYSLMQNIVDGSFGQGGNHETRSCSEGSGGGGGYYGGGSAYFGTGGGGSGYIGNSRLTNKVMYGYNVPITYDSWINNYLSDPKQFILNVDQDKTYSNIQRAFDEVEDGETLQLLDDTSITYDIETPDDIHITLDMNGYNLDTTKQITNNSNLKIINSTVDSIDDEDVVVETSESIYYYNGTKYNNLYTENTYQNDEATFETNYIDLPNDASGYYIVYTDTIDLSKYNSVIVKKTNFVGTRAKFAENPNLVDNVGETISPTWQNVSGDIFVADISSYTDTNKKFYIDADSGENSGQVYYIAFSSKTMPEIISDSSFIDNPTVTYSKAFSYTGNEQVFIAPEDGIYRLESWGGSGGSAVWGESINYPGGYGGYSSGTISLHKGDKLYINVGGAGTDNCLQECQGGYNGGGIADGATADSSYGPTYNVSAGSGGGATSIATTSGLLEDLEDNKASVVMVSGGGGGSLIHRYGNAQDWWHGYGGSAGGFESSVGNTPVTGRSDSPTKATQTTPGIGYTEHSVLGSGSFGKGQNGNVNPNQANAAGAGSGWYGGGASGYTATSGGSSYINTDVLSGAYMMCYNCSESNDKATKTISTTNTATTPTSGYANQGNGYVLITSINSTEKQTLYEFDYTGNEQVFTAPVDGTYRLDTWGAQGGSALCNGDDCTSTPGYGGYATGEIYLTAGSQLYINVGGQGGKGTLSTCSTGGYNGGGTGTNDRGSCGTANDDEASGGGGGATHIATTSGLLSSLETNKSSIIIVAGGGGGSSYIYDGASGGGMNGGINSTTNQTKATQSTGYAFGQGQNATGDGDSDGVAGGGGGYYGGYSNDVDYKSAGAGGSGYIGNPSLTKKQMACYDCDTSLDTNTKTILATNFSETPTINYAKEGNGYAKITLVDYKPVYTYDYTGTEEEFIAPVSGTYKLETWGAQGGSGDSRTIGGYGAYSTGEITLTAGEKLYINVGGAGTLGNYSAQTGGYNGGGNVTNYHSDGNERRGSGGGATHIAKASGLLKDLEINKDSVIIVAGGGGGAHRNYAHGSSTYSYGGAGGGFIGGGSSGTGDGTYNLNNGGTQTEVGSSSTNWGLVDAGGFGQGASSNSNGAGGGGGYYGGGVGVRGSGGGSGYIGNSLLKNKKMVMYTENSSYISLDENTLTEITSEVSDEATSDYAKSGNGFVKIALIDSKPIYTYNYTGTAQTFSAPKSGKYKIEAWGAQGTSRVESTDNNDREGGKGAYTTGIIELEQGDNLYIYVGEQGVTDGIRGAGTSRPYGTYGFNGGSGGNYTCYSYSGGSSGYNLYGGGATDIRLVSGNWDDAESLASRIMVASGGSAANENENGVPGGALNGISGSHGTGATQTSGGGPSSGTFGKAGIPTYGGNRCASSIANGAGSGYYGGGAYNQDRDFNGMYAAGSGSSYISGYTGSVAIKSATEVTPKTGCVDGTTNIECSYHYSGKVFTNTNMIDGASLMPTHNGSSTMTGNEGNGYVKITYIPEEENVNDYDYTGSEQVFTAPKTGIYKLETWGASGGKFTADAPGGYGGYSVGEIKLNSGDKLYINVGGQGTDADSTKANYTTPGGYNGGGSGGIGSSNYPTQSGGSGGGATSITTSSGLLSAFNNNRSSIVIVAGGGGGGSYASGGSGGGSTGESSKQSGINGGTYPVSTGGTQSTGNAFGQGQNGRNADNSNWAAGGTGGGGGGYYGGYTYQSTGSYTSGGGAGGSGYIGNLSLKNKKMVMYSNESTYESINVADKTEITDNVSNTATSNSAKIGNGYAKITFLSDSKEKIDDKEINVTTIDNFTYESVMNTQYDKMIVTQTDNLLSTVANAGNQSVTYYNNKIKVTEAKAGNVTVMGNLIYYNNYSNVSLGTMYVGLSKTNSNDIDFDYYEQYDIDGYELSGSDNIDFNLTPTEAGEYYFKIILVHNNNNANYNIYAELSNLKIRTVTEGSGREYSPSSINNNINTTLFVNNNILDIENVNFDVYNLVEGTSSSELYIDNSTIKSSNKAINSYGDITITNSSISAPYGIDTKKNLVLDNSFVKSTSQGIITSGSITITNSSINGTTYGIYDNATTDGTVTNSTIKSSSTAVYKSNSGLLTLNNNTITGSINNSGSASSLDVNYGSVTGQIANSGTSTYTKVPITYTSNYYNAENLINNSGIINMDESTVIFNSTYASGSSYRTSAIYNSGTLNSYKTAYNVYHTNGKYKWMIGINNVGLFISNTDSIEITGAGASYAILNETSNDCTITNININSHDNGSEIYGIRNLRGKLTINGGSVTMNNNTFTHLLYTSGVSNTTVTDTTFTSTNNSDHGIGIYMQDDGGTITIVRGTFNVTSTGSTQAIHMDRGTLTINDGLFTTTAGTTGYGINMANGTATIEKGTINVQADTAYGIYMSNGTYTQGIPDNSGTEQADVSITDPHIEAIGTTSGTGITTNNNGDFNFYDGIIIGSTRSRVSGETITNTDRNYQANTYTDENNYSYSILEFIK